MFVAFSVWAWFALRYRINWRFRIAWLGIVILSTTWFISLQPSHARNWKPEVSVIPRIEIHGDRARITAYRDFIYRSRDDFDVRHHERELDLGKLKSVDLFISYWNNGPMAHTFLSFGFEDAEPVCVSIEARPEIGERFGALPGLLKRFELFYVVGSERDIVRVRTNHRDERVIMYRLLVSETDARRLFEVYARQINRLAEVPEFYHLFRNNCTMNIVRNAEAAGRTSDFDFRMVLNGRVDHYLYEAGLISQDLHFDALRERAEITRIAQRAGNDSFSNDIRDGLPRMR